MTTSEVGPLEATRRRAGRPSRSPAQRRAILDAVARCGSVARAARTLGLHDETVRRIARRSAAGIARAEAEAGAAATRDAAILATAARATPEAPVRCVDIAGALGVSTAVVQRVLRREGISLPRSAPNRVPFDTRAAVLATYAAGLGVEATAGKFDLDRKTVWRLVREAGIMRPPNGPSVPPAQRLAAARLVAPETLPPGPDPDPEAEARRRAEQCESFLDLLRQHHGTPDGCPSLREVRPRARREADARSIAGLRLVLIDVAPALFGDPAWGPTRAPATVPSARFPGITLARISCLEAGL